MKYDCCAINQVKGTTNDFDSTPWCTTAGTCQSTASQIPKTCCNYVSEDDYGSAPNTCHSSVSPGTFKYVNLYNTLLFTNFCNGCLRAGPTTPPLSSPLLQYLDFK